MQKNILAPLGVTAAASANDAGIQKKIHGSGTTTLIISNKEMSDITKIVQVPENETKEQKWGFLGMFIGTLGASLLGSMLTGKGILRAGCRNKQGKGIVRAAYGSKKF